MIISILLITLQVVILGAWLWRSITYREDWRHLPMPDSWDKDKSRGRLYKGWLR